MNTLRKLLAMILMAAVLSLGLAGCSGSHEHPGEHPSGEHPTSEHPG